LLSIACWACLTKTAKRKKNHEVKQLCVHKTFYLQKRLLTWASEPMILPSSTISDPHTYILVCETVLVTRDGPWDYCHSQPRYYRITVRQNDSCCCRTITLWPGSQWKSCIKRKTPVYQILKNEDVLADNVSIPTKAITEGLRGGLTPLYKKVPLQEEI